VLLKEAHRDLNKAYADLSKQRGLVQPLMSAYIGLAREKAAAGRHGIDAAVLQRGPCCVDRGGELMGKLL